MIDLGQGYVHRAFKKRNDSVITSEGIKTTVDHFSLILL